MGCGTYVACRTCKEWWSAGYGSYGRTLEREQRPPRDQHDGHDVFSWIDDCEWGRENDTLYGMGSYGSRGEPIIEGLSQWTYLGDVTEVRFQNPLVMRSWIAG